MDYSYRLPNLATKGWAVCRGTRKGKLLQSGAPACGETGSSITLGGFVLLAMPLLRMLRRAVRKEPASTVEVPSSLVYHRSTSSVGQQKWAARTYYQSHYRVVGTYPSRAAAVAAYQTALIAAGAAPDPAPPRPSVPNTFRGVRLHLAFNSTGYMNVTRRGSTYRAAIQYRSDGGKRMRVVGNYDTAIEAA